MKDARENIERVLTGLRVAEPPAGMQRRILHAIEEHNAVASTSSFTVSETWPTAVAVCAGFLAVLWIVTIKVPQPPLPQLHHAPSMAQQPIAPASEPITVHRVHTVKRAKAALAQLASFPAPPLPLTKQEKLLLRVAHQRDPNNMATLNPAARAAQMAKATQQFQQFFGIDPKEMRSQIE